jgi:dGTPase
MSIGVLDSFGRGRRASFATDPKSSKGRLVSEPESPTRTPFQRDRDRIIHSTAFRRLKHKTQVFVYHESDHYRTRLTHTIEVAQIARSLARALHLDEDLAEALALVHDFGHTPFGHAGERALDRAIRKWGGFDHNAQSLRIVAMLEKAYADFDGLNLTWECLEGLVKHNGPLLGQYADPDEKVDPYILEFNKTYDLRLEQFSSLEAQVAAISDDIAYNSHDIDDGVRAGLFQLEDMGELPLIRDILPELNQTYPDLERTRLLHEFTRRQITRMVEDVIVETRKNITQHNPQSVEDIYAANATIAKFSDDMQEADKAIKAFLFKHMYHSKPVMSIMRNAETIIEDLFTIYWRDPNHMPKEWGQNPMMELNEAAKARCIADFIAGQTDRYAIKEHERLFDVTPDLG